MENRIIESPFTESPRALNEFRKALVLITVAGSEMQDINDVCCCCRSVKVELAL